MAKAPSTAGAAQSAKKRRTRRNVSVGVAHIKATFNNTVVTITDTKGDVLCWAAAGTSPVSLRQPSSARPSAASASSARPAPWHSRASDSARRQC